MRAKLALPAAGAVDRYLERVDALVVGGKLGPPSGTVNAHRAALPTDELARP